MTLQLEIDLSKEGMQKSPLCINRLTARNIFPYISDSDEFLEHFEPNTAEPEAHFEPSIEPDAHFETNIAESEAHFEPNIAEPEAHFEPNIAEPEAHFEPNIAEPDAHFEPNIADSEADFEPNTAEPEAHYEPNRAEPEAQFEPNITEPEVEIPHAGNTVGAQTDSETIFVSSRSNSSIREAAGNTLYGNDVIINEANDAIINENNAEIITEANDELINEPNDGIINEPNDEFINEANDKLINEANDGIITKANDEIINEATQEMTSGIRNDCANSNGGKFLGRFDVSIDDSEIELSYTTFASELQNFTFSVYPDTNRTSTPITSPTRNTELADDEVGACVRNDDGTSNLDININVNIGESDIKFSYTGCASGLQSITFSACSEVVNDPTGNNSPTRDHTESTTGVISDLNDELPPCERNDVGDITSSDPLIQETLNATRTETEILLNDRATDDDRNVNTDPAAIVATDTPRWDRLPSISSSSTSSVTMRCCRSLSDLDNMSPDFDFINIISIAHMHSLAAISPVTNFGVANRPSNANGSDHVDIVKANARNRLPTNGLLNNPNDEENDTFVFDPWIIRERFAPRWDEITDDANIGIGPGWSENSRISAPPLDIPFLMREGLTERHNQDEKNDNVIHGKRDLRTCNLSLPWRRVICW